MSEQSLGLKWLTYLSFVAGLSALAYEFPFLFELPLAGSIGGAYWVFFRKAEG
jgi:hypothetical protein